MLEQALHPGEAIGEGGGGLQGEPGIEDHRPLGVVVRQENYSVSFADYKHMVFFHWVIKNTGAPLRNAWLGL